MQHIYLCHVALDSWEVISGIVIAVLGFAVTFAEYRKSNKVKRAEFLEKLIDEFNEEKMYIAKKLLDDFWYNENVANPADIPAKIFIASGSKEKKPGAAAILETVLRAHYEDGSEPINEVEQRVRESFDELLDFFTKLEYYLSLKLISKQELYYFEYYVDRCYTKARGGVKIFAAAYGYISLFRLFYVMNTDKKNKEYNLKKPDFTSNAQELYYHDLRNDLNIL